MASYVYEIEERDRDEFILSRQDVETETDPNILADWHRGLEDRHDILTMQIETYRENPKDDRESLLWLHRVCMAKAATNIGLTRLNRRRVQLGLIPNPADGRIRVLEDKLMNAKAQIAALKGEDE